MAYLPVGRQEEQENNADLISYPGKIFNDEKAKKKGFI